MKRLLLNVLLWSLALCAIGPLLWLAAAAFKQGPDLLTWSFLPWPHLDRLTLDNFRILWTDHPFGAWFVNSLFLASTQTLIATLLCSLGGFALARYRFYGKRLIYALMLLTVLVPSQVTLGGLYELMDRLGWVNTWSAILLPGAVSVFGLFLFRQALVGISEDLLDAARMDGCSEWRLWWSIAMPMVRPMTGAFVLLSFLATWNAYLWPQIILQDPARFTLPLGLANLLATPGARIEFGVLMAGTLVSLAPVMILFALANRELIPDLSRGGGK